MAIRISRSPSEFDGKAAVAYIAVADMKSAKWDVWSVKSDLTYKTNDSYKTPAEVYQEQNCPIVINGGYFFWSDGNYTSSLAVSNGEVLAYNINYASEDWISVYYPTRAAFVQKKDGKFDACWTYATSSGQHYAYQTPADNSYSKSPLDVPSATFPEKASEFVRLKWKDTALIYLPVNVTYPENGVSHYHLVKDNIRISIMFTRTFVGMIFRIPVLAFRKIAGKGIRR